jgi:hypothetical protein
MALPPGWRHCGDCFVDDVLRQSQSVRPVADSKSWALQSDRGQLFWQCADASTGGSFWIDDPFPWRNTIWNGQTLWVQTLSGLRFLEQDHRCHVQPTKPCIKFQHGQCHRGDSCRYIHDFSHLPGTPGTNATRLPHPAIWPSTSASTMNFSQKPFGSDRPRRNTCNRFQHGDCRFGDLCKYEHVIDFCHRFQRNRCELGDQCSRSHYIDARRTHHPSPPTVVDSEVNLSMSVASSSRSDLVVDRHATCETWPGWITYADASSC